MFLQLIVFLIILLATLYFSTQGVFSSLIVLACAAFASVLAMGIFEPTSTLLASRPDFARPVAFMGVFFLAFGTLRFVSGVMLPRNIPLPKWVDRVGGGVIGFFNALIIWGTVLIAIAMLPTYQTILGYDRYPDGVAQQDDHTASRLWIPADDFTVGLWRLASGGTFGGADFFKTYPYYLKTLYGYRHTVQYESRRAIFPDLVKLDKAYLLKDPVAEANVGVNAEASAGHQTVVVRLVVQKGVNQPDVSADDAPHALMHTTPTQLHLVTDKGHEYFPTAQLEGGFKFVPMDMVRTALVEDYPKSDKIPQDWVFVIPDDENPTLLEYKQFSRFDLSGLKDAKPEAFARYDGPYPPMGYLKDAPVITIRVAGSGGGASDVNVLVVSMGVKKRTIVGSINASYDKLVALGNDQITNQFIDLKTHRDPDENVRWTELGNIMVRGARQAPVDDPARYQAVMDELQRVIHGAITSSQTYLLMKTDGTGRTEPTRFTLGTYAIIAWRITPTKFEYWSDYFEAEKNKDMEKVINADGPTVTVTK